MGSGERGVGRKVDYYRYVAGFGRECGREFFWLTGELVGG